MSRLESRGMRAGDVVAEDHKLRVQESVVLRRRSVIKLQPVWTPVERDVEGVGLVDIA